MAVIQKPLVIFTNGYWARQIRMYPTHKDKKGKKRKRIKLALSDPIREEYNIKDNVMIGDYPNEKVVILSEEHTHPCVLIDCGVKGETTNYQERNTKFYEVIRIYEETIQSNMLNIAYLQEQNEELRGVNEEYMKKIAGYIRIMGLKDKKDDTSSEEEDESGS